jgi:cytochrome c peroxidase
MVTTLGNRPTSYTYRDAPAVLAALLRGAIIDRRPVAIVWCEGGNLWDGEAADILGALVQPLTLNPHAGVARVRTEAGAETDIPLADVASADLMDAECEVAA